MRMYRHRVGGDSVAGDAILICFGGGMAAHGTLAVFYTLCFEMGRGKAHPVTQPLVTPRTASVTCANLL